MKVKFSKRVLAYIIDIIIVGIIVSLLTMLIPVSERQKSLYKQSEKLNINYSDKKIDTQEYLKKFKDINYDLSKETVILNVINIAAYIVYFVIFQTYNNGQTIGKKAMKIKLNGIQTKKIDTNLLLIRTLLLYGIWANIINQILILFLNKDTYNYLNTIINIMQLAIITTIVVSTIIRKNGRGIHDIISKTEVMEYN